MIKKFCRMNIFKKDLYFICNTNIFCVKIHFSSFYIFIYIFLCKKSFLSKKIFQYKNIFSANNIYFVKKIYFFKKKKKSFFNLVLQQLNNHRLRDIMQNKCSYINQPSWLKTIISHLAGLTHLRVYIWKIFILPRWDLGKIK